jgi:Flp pilus assembly pilin Flp
MRNRIWRWALEALQKVHAGQGLTEYGLLISLIAAATAAILVVFGDSVTTLFSQASNVIP